MNILSFNHTAGSHDNSAALVCDGELIAAAEEERFSRHKHDSAVPLLAIEFCLRQAGLTMEDIHLLAFPAKPYRTGRDSQLAEADVGLIERLYSEGTTRRRNLWHKYALNRYLRLRFLPDLNLGLDRTIGSSLEAVRRHFGRLPRLRFYDHHMAHAAAAFLTAGLDRAAVITVDGRGGIYATATWRAQQNKLHRLAAEPWTNSLGFFYAACTQYLGLGQFGEGKAMGLAPYGQPDSLAARVSQLLDTEGTQWYRYVRSPAAELLGFAARNGEDILSGPYPHFAAACQRATERAIARVADAAMEAAGSRDLCLGGGVMLNCSSNGSLAASGLASSVWVFPAAGDAGLPVGAALLAAAEQGEWHRQRLQHAYFGPSFTPQECEAAVAAEGAVRSLRPADLYAEVAQAIAAGKIVGWFQGRMEMGPRALGNRSILADPRSAEIRDRLNRLKGRERWRPLAPAVLAERAHEYFDLKAPSPFMLFAAPVKPDKQCTVPGVVHVDGSARPQTVTAAQNPRFHGLLSAYAKITGIPLVINTSFNAAGEPIVCTPTDAIRSFLRMGLDVLVLGDLMVTRDAPEAPRGHD